MCRLVLDGVHGSLVGAVMRNLVLGVEVPREVWAWLYQQCYNWQLQVIKRKELTGLLTYKAMSNKLMRVWEFSFNHHFIMA
ncbi:hypothetical protein L2E82_30951 [Cichorium intybus]|uniref:Uncharacterized protein n=1 Tax=Cichorium intybus TaxID=13427 RepID=A0ACB9D1Z4_CICIN|nr:hypothetical protein L2E82_30951 [Cichorium intybus]